MRKFTLSCPGSRGFYLGTFAIKQRFCQKLTRWMRRSGLICLARSSRTGLDMSHRSEERFSRNAETDLVCRLLLEKKKKDRLAVTRSSYKMMVKPTHAMYY